MKTITYLLLLLFIVGCNPNNKPTATTERTKAYRVIYHTPSLNKFLRKYNYRYKIVCVDTRNWTRNKRDILATREIVAKFGRDLGRKAIILNLVTRTSQKRAYVNKIQRKLSSYYNLDTQAPFFIFYKGDGNSYKPYKIVSISSIPRRSLKKSLSLLAMAINSGKSNRAVYASLNRIKQDMYASNRGKVGELLVEALKATL